MFNQLVHILFWVAFAYCVFSVLYFLIFAIGAHFAKKEKLSNYSEPVKRIAILVPAYKEDSIILSTAKNLLSLDYPNNWYDIYIIADSFQQQTIIELKNLPVKVIEVSFENSTKTKSLNEAFKQINKQYNIALICDADNHLSDDFLRQVNCAFANGAKAIQGRRVAKNTDTEFAMLDGFSEAINNNIFRKGANALGLSSAVIGSGMAFEFDQLKNVLSEISVVSGFDKLLQFKIVQSGIKIKYLEDALVFDEKIDNAGAFQNQRKRWLLSQFTFLKRFFFKGCQQLLKGNLSYFNLAVLNNIVPPRVLLIFILFVFSLLSYFVQPHTLFFSFTALTVVYFLTLFIALPNELISKKMLPAIIQLPQAIILMVSSLFSIKKAKNVFIHTVHTKTEISNPLYNIHDK
ncbi:MAG: glycosyltransferase family 2 protein [Bacteroidetes bacterium]|nr:glycosyltransferase family 2 protein [Bacteroidota bacterium]